MNQESASVSDEAVNYGPQITALLRRLTKLYDTMLGRDLKSIGLTPPQLMVLKQIISGPKTLGQIAQAIQLSNSTVSGILDRLERDGWIERVRDESDRRIIWIRRTDKISELKNKFALFQDSFYDHLFDDISPEELAHVMRSLDILTTHLEAKVNCEHSSPSKD